MDKFSWEYFSFLKLDLGVAYQEVLVIPLLLVVLSAIWMKLVKGENDHLEKETEEEKMKEGIDIVQAYKDALLNEVDSGTELDSPNEDEDDEAEEKKEKESEHEEQKDDKEEVVEGENKKDD